MYEVQLEKSHFPAQADTPYAPTTLGELLRRSAGTWPDNPALREILTDGSSGRSWSYAEFLADSLRLAEILAARHTPGSRVAVWAPNIPEWPMMEFALAFAGVTLVTVNPSYQPRELEFVLKQSGAEAIYYVEEFRGNQMKAIADEVCDRLPQIRHRIDLADPDALFAGDRASLPEISIEDEAQIQYTSGTTGFPKGAQLHHRGLTQNALDIMKIANFREGDRSLNYLPMFHTTGCGIVTIGTLAHGGEILLARQFIPSVMAEVIERERIEFLFGVPTMLIALIEEAKRAGRDFSAVRSVTSGGSMVSPELAKAGEAWFGSLIKIVYGQTEASPVITMVREGSSFEDATETVGQPAPHLEVSIRDPQTNEVLPLGEQGEICARGYNVMTAYNDNPEATAKTIDADGWLHTGDLGSMDARGFVKITGRVKEMIIRGGENVFPVEIENAMLENDDVIECAVAGVPDEKWGEQIACFMRAAGDARPDAAALKAFIRERISPQKTPAYWVWIEEWPLTGSGKIQKFKLVETFQRGEFDVLTA